MPVPMGSTGHRIPRSQPRSLLNPVRHLNLGLDAELADALLASARKNERRLTEECRYAVRQYLKIDETPAEDNAGVSA
jgi:hypothetical protein